MLRKWKYEPKMLILLGVIIAAVAARALLTAGIFALFSPCGFPMLPGYISYYIGTKPSLEKAVPRGVACALGLIAVFSVIGTVASVLGNFVSQYMPLFELVAGPAMVFMGVAMIIEIRLPAFWARIKVQKRKGLTGIFLYGAVYGLATIARVLITRYYTNFIGKSSRLR